MRAKMKLRDLRLIKADEVRGGFSIKGWEPETFKPAPKAGWEPETFRPAPKAGWEPETFRPAPKAGWEPETF